MTGNDNLTPDEDETADAVDEQRAPAGLPHEKAEPDRIRYNPSSSPKDGTSL